MNEEEILSKINNYSHAYLIDTNDLDSSYSFVKELAKKIIISTNDELLYTNDQISSLIEENNFDDFYVLNPDTNNIKIEELNELFNYFETKSLRNNGNRVYVIYGMERFSTTLSNKILKFLEEPENNIYGILMTQNINVLLPTIISRCQTIKLSYETTFDDEKLNNMKNFLSFFIKNRLNTIAYTNNYWLKYEGNRKDYVECFSIIERILSSYINKYHDVGYEKEFYLEDLSILPIEKVIEILRITNKIKGLINYNINLNLLIDRYIIEMERGDLLA